MSESPFAKANSSFTLYLEPILNTYYKTYQNVITLSNIPPGPLSDMVATISTPNLSPFQQAPIIGNNPFNCTYALVRYPVRSGCSTIKNSDYFMVADDIPSVISYLQENGYTIDTALSTMLFKAKIPIGGVSDTRISGNRKMILMARGKP